MCLIKGNVSNVTNADVGCKTVTLESERIEDSIKTTDEKQRKRCNFPSHKYLMEIKRKKKLFTTGTEIFNTNPKKGIQYLQEQELLSVPLDPCEVATFLRENPHLDKKQIGEYISHRSNRPILEQFVR